MAAIRMQMESIESIFADPPTSQSRKRKLGRFTAFESTKKFDVKTCYVTMHVKKKHTLAHPIF